MTIAGASLWQDHNPRVEVPAEGAHARARKPVGAQSRNNVSLSQLARDPRERWPCLSRGGCPSITHLQARGMSTEENLNEPEDDAQGQHFQLEAHALRFRDYARNTIALEAK